MAWTSQGCLTIFVGVCVHVHMFVFVFVSVIVIVIVSVNASLFASRAPSHSSGSADGAHEDVRVCVPVCVLQIRCP